MFISERKVFYNSVESSSNAVIMYDELVDNLIDVWKLITHKTCNRCINANCASNTRNDLEDIVGAHVMGYPGKVEAGKTVYIIPLCKTCNNQKDSYFVIKSSIEIQCVSLRTIDMQ